MNQSIYILLVTILTFVTTHEIAPNFSKDSEVAVTSMDQNITKSEIPSEISNRMRAEDYLMQEVPEIKDYGSYISEKSNGKAHLIVDCSGLVEDVYKNEDYYMIYVGERWEDHKVNWDWFFVSEEFDEVLWYYILDAETYSLSEWRNSSHYRDLDQ